MTGKRWTLYLAHTVALRRLMRDCRTPFENANMSDWRARLAACNSPRAIDALMREFEVAEAMPEKVSA